MVLGITVVLGEDGVKVVELCQPCDDAGGYNEEYDGQAGMTDSIWDGGALLTP